MDTPGIAAVTRNTDQEAYEYGRKAGSMDRRHNTHAPQDFAPFTDSRYFFQGYEYGWALEDLIMSETFDSADEARFELDVTYAELNGDR